MSTADDFFNSSSGAGFPAFSFANIGDTLSGEIVGVSDPITQPKMGTTTGETETSIVFDIRTDAGEEFALWVSKPALKTAIADAVRAAGQSGAPKVGGRLGVQHNATRPSKTPGFSPQKLYVAQYAPPSVTPAANAVFDQAASAPAAPAVSATSLV